jgi:hypothetical protein
VSSRELASRHGAIAQTLELQVVMVMGHRSPACSPISTVEPLE